MAYADNHGIKIYYETSGSGPALVLVIGLGGTAEAWKNHVPVYSNAYQVITLDNRGVGRSDKPDISYDMEMMASDLKAILDDLKLDKAVFLGLSMGGLIVQEFYHLYPERVKALILGCSGVGAGDPAYIYPGLSVLDFLSNTKKSDPNYYDRFIRYFYHPDFREKVPNLAEKLRESSSKTQFSQPDYAYQRQLEACVLKKFNSPRLKDIKVPTLVIHGEDDLIWPLENAKYLAEHIPNAKLEIIPNSAHMFFVEVFEEFNRRVLKFLAEIK